MPKRKRQPNYRLVKAHRSYTIEMVVKGLDVHRNTVRDWVKRGLQLIDTKRPTMISGQALRGFLQQRRQSKKRPCAACELYCLRCRAPKVPGC